jgi:MGT family glycosyltransferase
MVRRMGREVLFGPADRFARDVLDTLRQYPAEGVLADVTQFGALIGAERSGLPVIGLLPSIYVRPTRGHPVMGSGAADSHGPVAAVRDTVGPYVLLRLLRLGLPRVNAVRAQVGLDPVGAVLDLWDRCARLLVLTSPSFDPPPARLPANVRYVGPMTDDPPWARPWTPPWPLGDRPFVLVAMSSTYQAHDALLRRVVTALDGMPVHALVTLGPGLRDGEVPGTATVAVVASAPHAQLLPAAAVVVTHAGHGSVVKALAAGVPMVCIPHGRDQGDNTARVVAAGAGVRLSRRASADAIRAAVHRVLTDASYRRNATRLAQAIARAATHGPDPVTEVEQSLHRSKEGSS